MLLWFVGTSVLTVWFVFRDPRFDYRLLALGSLLPDIIDLPMRHARWAHSLTVAVGVLVAIMLATAGRKPIRRLLLALPIGMMLHLVFDGIFSSTKVFWWPFAGSWGDVRVPSLQRGWLNVLFELAGAGMLAWAWKRFGLGDARRRQTLLRHGHLADARPDVRR